MIYCTVQIPPCKPTYKSRMQDRPTKGKIPCSKTPAHSSYTPLQAQTKLDDRLLHPLFLLSSSSLII